MPATKKIQPPLPLRLGVSVMKRTRSLSLAVLACLCVSAASLSCSSKPTDPRSVIPADALVYLETADLGKAAAAITESDAFAQVSTKKPDLSALNGVPVSVAVMGFRSDEQQVGEDQFVGRIIPQFVAAAQTNAWSWQASSFVENKLGEFINEAYGGGIELVVTPKDGGKYYVWTAPDGRKLYALLTGSLVLFGNDESAIEKCQAVRRGEADSIAKNPKLQDGDRLAFGYVSPDGIAQLANIEGVSLAMQAGEDAEVKSFVARVLPEMLRKSVSELTWTSVAGITDEFDIVFSSDVARPLSEALSAQPMSGPTGLEEFIPKTFGSVTRYDLADPRAAWQGVLRTALSRTDAVSGKLIATFSGSLFEPYAIEDAERFLGAVRGDLVTVKLDAESDDSAVIAKLINPAEVRKAIAKEIPLSQPAGKIGDAEIWRSADGNYAAAFAGDIVVLGDADVVQKCLEARQSGENISKTRELAGPVVTPRPSAVTVYKDGEIPAKLAQMFGEANGSGAAQTVYSATTFNATGARRTVRSDFGMIGTLIAQFGPESDEAPPPAAANR